MNQYLTQDDCLSKLGKRIQNLRADRPDEWTMDDFIRDADNMQLKMEDMHNLIIDLQAVLRSIQNTTNPVMDMCDEERKRLSI